VYSIKKEIGRLDNFKIGMVGDLLNGRTVRSLAYLLSMYEGVKVYFVAPEVVRMKQDIKDFLSERGVHWEEVSRLVREGRALGGGPCWSTHLGKDAWLSTVLSKAACLSP
jgi:aspartate carbamoyltransferase catalytic subunit